MPDNIINFTTHALGDNIAFSPYADLSQKKHGGKVYVKTKWHNIIKSNNPDVIFVDIGFNIPNAVVKNVDFIFQRGPLQKIICDQLQIEYKEIRPSINTESKYSFNKKKKYVCIGIQSTAQLKYWNLNDGWEKLTKYIKDKGYDVYCIDKDEVFGTKEKWNRMPHNARNETGNHPIEYRIQQLKNCQFYIGVSSGLSWLAWALGKKVVLVSGCTDENNEFSEDCYRVINKNVCHGCLNDPAINNTVGIKSGWMYCPRNKNFECTKKISLDDVKIAVNKCIYDIDSQTDLKHNTLQ
jgi:autotransporter strand-loop-strand O-heptosyltransferase